MPNLDDILKTKLDMDVTIERDPDFADSHGPIGTVAVSHGGEDYGVTTAGITEKTRDRAQANANWLMNSIGKNRGSIAAMAARNTFEFPVFCSNSLSLPTATATCQLLEHVYANFLQCAIVQDPVVSQYAYAKGQALEKFRSNTGGYVENCDMPYTVDACHCVMEAGNVIGEFNMATLPEKDLKHVVEYLEHDPLSEFNHFFQESIKTTTMDRDYVVDPDTRKEINVVKDKDSNEWHADGDPDRKFKASQVMHEKISESEDNDMDNIEDQRAQRKLDRTQREVNQRRATFSSKVGKFLDPVNAVADTVQGAARAGRDVVGLVNDVRDHKTNVEHKKAQAENFRASAEKTRLDIDHYNEKLKNDINKQTRAPSLLDESKVAKLNTMKPLMMTVNLQVIDAQGHIQAIETLVGVKTRCHVVDASMFPEVAKYPVETMNKVSRKIKWKAGELKFGRDLVWQKREKKQTAFDKLDVNRRWYRRLYELAQRKGDALATRATKSSGKGIKGLHSFISKREEYGMLPNATIIMTKNDVDNVKTSTNIDLLKSSTAAKFCDDMFLICFVVIDEDAEAVHILIPDQNRSFDTQSMDAINKQMANLGTSGARANEVFKLLK